MKFLGLRPRFTVLVVLVGVAVFTSPLVSRFAFAYELRFSRWCISDDTRPGAPYVGTYKIGNLNGLNLTPAQAEQQIGAASLAWNTALPGQWINFLFVNDQSGQQKRTWTSGNLPSGVQAFTNLGQTTVPCFENKANRPTTTVSRSVVWTEPLLLKVATHEFGHWLSLGHDRWSVSTNNYAPDDSPCNDPNEYNIHDMQSVMACPESRATSTLQREDLAGARCFYGSTAAPIGPPDVSALQCITSPWNQFTSDFYPGSIVTSEGWTDTSILGNTANFAESTLRLNYNTPSGEAGVRRNLVGGAQTNVLYEAMFLDTASIEPGRVAEMRVWSDCGPTGSYYALGVNTSFSFTHYFFDKSGSPLVQGPSRTLGLWHTFRILTKDGVTWGEIDGTAGPAMSVAQTCSINIRAMGSLAGTYSWDSASAFPSTAVAPTPGKRVYIAGIKPGGVPFFAWTEDIYAASPVWQENSTALPSNAGGLYFSLDHGQPTNVGVIGLWNTGAGSAELWRNTNLRGGGAWAKAFDVSTWNTLTGRSDASIEITTNSTNSNRRGVAYTKAQPDLFGFMVSASGTIWVVHSHDNGNNFAASQVPDPITGYNNMVWGQHDANIVYAHSGFWAIGRNFIKKSADGGHTWTQQQPLNYDGSESFAMPYHGNPNDTTLFTYTNGWMMRSTDSGITWSVISTQSDIWVWSLDRADLTGVGIASDWGTAARRSADGGQTWTLATSPGAITDLFLLNQGAYFACGYYSQNKVLTSSDWVSFTDRSGNIDSVLGGGGSCTAVVSDPSS